MPGSTLTGVRTHFHSEGQVLVENPGRGADRSVSPSFFIALHVSTAGNRCLSIAVPARRLAHNAKLEDTPPAGGGPQRPCGPGASPMHAPFPVRQRRCPDSCAAKAV